MCVSASRCGEEWSKELWLCYMSLRYAQCRGLLHQLLTLQHGKALHHCQLHLDCCYCCYRLKPCAKAAQTNKQLLQLAIFAGLDASTV